MPRTLTLILLAVLSLTASAQDVVGSYKLSELTSYLRLSKIGADTYHDLRAVIDSIDRRHHSANYVIDLQHTQGDYGMAAVTLADSLMTHRQRFAIIIGSESGGAAQQVAMFLWRAGRAITLGTVTADGLQPDILYSQNNSHMTEWYDSISAKGIMERAAKEYAHAFDVKATYPTADLLLDNVNENGALIGFILELAEKEGIARNDKAFYYSGYHTVSMARAFLVREVFPEAHDTYERALNVPVQQVIADAMEIMESQRWREMTRREMR